jgi:protein TonB
MLAADPLAEGIMLSQLIDSRPVRRRSPAGFAASIALHGIIIAGAVIATSRDTRQRRPDFHTVVVEFPAPEREPPKASPPSTSPATPSVPAGPGIISVPIVVQDLIPPVGPLRTLINTDQPFEFRIGTPSRAGTPEPGALPGPGVLLVDQVEVPAAFDTRSPLPRFPQVLRDAGVEGMARFRFVVDTLGRVELETVQVVESTHQAFALAVRATLPRMRFAPARVGGRPVRQLVEFPVQFRLDR